MQQAITILIADAQYLTRVGLRNILSTQQRFEICDEAGNESTLLQQLQTWHPQVVILDYDHPDCFSHDTILHIKQVAPATNILVISGDSDKHSIYQVLENGVNSFLTKNCNETEIIDAVQATAKGEKFFCTRVLDYLLEKSFGNKEENCAPTPLTPRQIDIVKLTAKGLIAKEIANELNLSIHTVYTHRKEILKKLDLKTSSELVMYAVNKGILEKN
jgi:DNA-binding NarL/FixJ family response regulator